MFIIIKVVVNLSKNTFLVRLKMTLFYNNTIAHEAQLQKLLERMVLLRLAVLTNEIDSKALKYLAQLSTVQLDEKVKVRSDKYLEKLDKIVSSNALNEAIIQPSESLIASLKWFDQEHGEYLDLVPLTARDPCALGHYFNHLAVFYDVFIQEILIQINSNDYFSLDINMDQVHARCRDWQRTRTCQTFYNPHHRTLRLVDRFLTGSLLPNEWLIDLDIFDAFRGLELDKFGAHIATLDVASIGAILDLERKHHERDEPTVPYAISLILNNSRTLDDEGTHWTRLLIIVDPTKKNPDVSAHYTDSLSTLHKRNITSIIRDALNYQEINIAVEAFPRYKQHIKIQATKEQDDGYSCGYRALQGLLYDLVEAGLLANPTTRQRHFLACKTSAELCYFIYHLLMNEQTTTLSSPNLKLVETRANGRYVKPACIEGQLQQWYPHQTLDLPHEAVLSTSDVTSTRQGQFACDEQKIQNYLQQCAARFNTKAYRNMLQGKFDLQPQTDCDEELSSKLMSALLYLRYQTYRRGNALAHAQLKTELQKLLNHIQQSHNPMLLAAVAKAQQEHFSALSSHWTDHEPQKRFYLRKIMTEWRRSSLGEIKLQWKTADFFNTWWHGSVEETSKNPQTPTMQSQAIRWLSDYKDKWWKRAWVSRDRKTIATTLINQLKNLNTTNSNPSQILQFISDARQTILNDDIKHHRSIDAGLRGRLYCFLNDLETRVYAASSPVDMDHAIQHEFNEIKTVLSAFQQRTIYKHSLRRVLDAMNLAILSADNPNKVASQYQLVSEFFTRVLTNLKPETLKENDDLSTLYSYCQQKQADLVHFFGQCSQLSAINQQRSVQVFRAMSAAASTVVDQWFINEPKDKHDAHQSHEIHYQTQKIPLTIGINVLNDLPLSFVTQSSSFLFFNKKSNLNIAKINKICTDLITVMATKIMAHDPSNDVKLKFTSLELNSCDKKPQLLKLSVALCLDGIDSKVTYTIDAHTGKLVHIRPDLKTHEDSLSLS